MSADDGGGIWLIFVEEGEGGRFSVVESKDGCVLAFLWREVVPDLVGGGGHFWPAKHIGVALEGALGAFFSLG